MHKRFPFSGTHYPVPDAFHGVGSRPRRASRGKTMNPLYLLAGIIAIGLLLYLVLALVKPEWFG
jgi:K+-transporting ATPase KdpF subunit